MAAIGKIRSWGPWLVGIIGLALFGFIATDFTKSCETSSNQDQQQLGVVMGHKLSQQDFLVSVEEFKNLFKQMGRDVDEEDLRDFAWGNFVQNTIIEEEAEKLGLGVTEDEMKGILQSGSHPVLRSLPIVPQFFNQQTGLFDYNNVTQYYNFLKQNYPTEYAEFDSYWKTVEKLLGQQLLASKYFNLLSACMLSNEYSAKAAFDGRYTESAVQLAMLSYSSVNDNDVKIEDKDLRAKYESLKNRFKWNQETRDIKYLLCRISPSEADINGLRSTIASAAESLVSDSLSLADIVSMYRSTVPYHANMPFNAEGLRAISSELLAAIDNLSPDSVTAPVAYTVQDGTRAIDHLAVAKLLRKYQGVDSLAYQVVGVTGQNLAETNRLADSVLTVLNNGAQFDSVAIGLNQSGEKMWISANQYQTEENVTPDFETFFTALHSAELNKVNRLALPGNTVLIFKVVEKRQPVTLYDVAVISNPLVFSTDTYNKVYNDFSTFVSSNSSADSLAAKAMANNYMLQEQENLQSAAHVIGQVDPYSGVAQVPNSRVAVKWVFSEAGEGSVSKIYQENASTGLLYAVYVTKVHPQGFLDQASVEELLRDEVLKDKKAERLTAQLAGAKSIAEAMAKGADTTTVEHITFPTRVTFNLEAGRRVTERNLSGAVAATPVGQTVGHVVKGDEGVYLFTVTDRHEQEGATFDRRKQEQQLISAARSLIQKSQYSYRNYTDAADVLQQKANITDRRVRF